jgi:uncharacterized Zn-binding protein involved in type VI secretion
MGVPLVTMGATCKCSFGAAPCTLTVLPAARTNANKKPAATIMDNKVPNLPTFGMCSSMANPQVAAATAAAMGTLTPMPCVPVIPGPWTPGSPTVMIGGKPAAKATDTCMCTWGGVVTVVNPGSTTSMVG